MKSKEVARQRPLLVDWPVWQQLPTESRQQAEHLLACMCIEVLNPNYDSNNKDHDSAEQRDERIPH